LSFITRWGGVNLLSKIFEPVLAQKFNYFINTFISCCVPIFFAVNGALLLNKPLNLKKHVKKTIKIIILIYFWSAITLLLQMPALGKLSLKDYFTYIFSSLLGYNNHLWFLTQIVMIYIMFPLFKYLFDKSKKYYFALMCLGIFFTLGYSIVDSFCIITGFEIMHIFNYIRNTYLPIFDSYYSFALVYFMVGGFIQYKYKFIREKINVKKLYKIIFNISMVVIIIGMMVFSYFYGKARNVGDNVWCGYSYSSSFIIVCCLMLMGIVNDNQKHTKAISIISNQTMGIYLLHFFIQSYVHLLLELFLTPYVFPFTGLKVTITLILSFILSFGINKIKYVNQLLKL